MAPADKTVKPLDDMQTLLPEHVGLDLWRAATSWRDALHREMVRRGHTWYGDARGALVAHLHPGGMSQAALVRAMGSTKQAVAQLLDGLEADGVVRRTPDPDDGRGKLVVYTAKGLAALRDAVTVKTAMQRRLQRRIGSGSLGELTTLLRSVQACFGESESDG